MPQFPSVMGQAAMPKAPAPTNPQGMTVQQMSQAAGSIKAPPTAPGMGQRQPPSTASNPGFTGGMPPMSAPQHTAPQPPPTVAPATTPPMGMPLPVAPNSWAPPGGFRTSMPPQTRAPGVPAPVAPIFFGSELPGRQYRANTNMAPGEDPNQDPQVQLQIKNMQAQTNASRGGVDPTRAMYEALRRKMK